MAAKGNTMSWDPGPVNTKKIAGAPKLNHVEHHMTLGQKGTPRITQKVLSAKSKPLKSFSTHALNLSKQMLTSAKTRVMIKVFSYDILDIASDCQSGVLAFINSENDT